VPALVCFALLPLAKEPLVLVPLAVATWDLLRNRVRPADAALTASTVVPALLWWLYARVHLGAWFTAGGDTVLQSPLAGWRRALLDAGVNSYAPGGSLNQLGETAVVLAVALGGLLFVGAVLATRLRNPVQAAYLPLVLIVACLSPAATVNPRDLLRVTSVLVVLVPFALATTFATAAGSESGFAARAGRRSP
jgi:hypothetical protein